MSVCPHGVSFTEIKLMKFTQTIEHSYDWSLMIMRFLWCSLPFSIAVCFLVISSSNALTSCQLIGDLVCFLTESCKYHQVVYSGVEKIMQLVSTALV